MSVELTVLLVLGFAIVLVLVLKYGGIVRSEEDRAYERHQKEVYQGRVEPAGPYEQVLSGWGQQTRDPEIAQALAKTLDAPPVVPGELVEQWVAEGVHLEPGEACSTGNFRFRRIRDAKEIDGSTESEIFDFSVVRPEPEWTAGLGLGESFDDFLLVDRTALSLSCSMALGAGEFEPTEAEAVRRWLEDYINEGEGRLLRVDIFMMRGGQGGGRSIGDSLLLAYDSGANRAIWPPIQGG